LILKNRGRGQPKKVVILPHFSSYASRAGYRPGPPTTIAPFLTRLELNRYDYEMRDLSLNKVAAGNASTIMPVRR
jgi:hypothetical protein